MKNVNVLLAVVLCAGLCVLFGLFNRSADESLGWSPNDMYMQSISSGEGASFTSANLSGGNVSNDGVAVSMRNGSFSLRTRASRASSLTPNNPIASSPNNLPSLQGGDGGRLSSSGSLIGHMTSSAEYHSFGGGHSGNMGSAMTGMTNSGNVAASFAYSSPSYGVANTGLSSYSPITVLPGTDGTQVMSAEQALISTSSSASGLFGGYVADGNAYSSFGQAAYDEYFGYASTPSGVRGKQNAGPGSSAYNSWLAWLLSYGQGKGWEGNSWEFDNEGAWNAFLAWFESTYGQPYDPEDPNGGMGVPVITYEQWLSWFTSNGGTHNYNGYTYKFTPVGNILPLLLMALMYMIVLFVKRNKTAQL